MADNASSSYGSVGLGELLALVGGANPLAGISKSVAQFQRGVTQFMDSVDKFNDTMDQLNQVSRRVNSLLDTVEEPVRAMVPQLTRTIRTADAMVEQLNALPKELTQFMEVIGDVARRLQPLGQLAESAGSMFGLRPLAALRSGSGTRPVVTPEPALAPVKQTAATQSAPAKKKAPPKKAAAKKSPAKKKPPAKKATART